MPTLLWDASALIKRNTLEAGSDVVDALFAALPQVTAVATLWGYAETYASLWRKRNRGDISTAFLQSALTLLRSELRLSTDWVFLTIDDAAVLTGIDLLRQHNLNATDAALLATYLRYARSQPAGSPTSVLVAADQRLLRAAGSEGLTTVDPEAVAAADIPAPLATW
jgi:predicted nucleic acid-binding protein